MGRAGLHTDPLTQQSRLDDAITGPCVLQCHVVDIDINGAGSEQEVQVNCKIG